MGQSLGKAMNAAEWVFPVIPPTYNRDHKQLVTFMCEEVGAEVPAMLLAPPGLGGEKARGIGRQVVSCAIYFHPNAVDIGDCIEDMEAICDGAYGGDAVVLAPEYPGYGLLGDFEPSVNGIDLVAMSAWKYAREDLGFCASRIMLWGRSIGCGPATKLALQLASSSSTSSVNKRGGSLPPPAEGGNKAQGRAEEPAPAPKAEREAVMKASRPPGGASRSASKEAALAPPVGALMLIAPFLSISSVVQHHTASSFLASFVGPMWQVENYVQDEHMEDVPLCILHPKEDDIIPSQHGLALYQTSVSKQKYGIWLSNASHNFQPEEDHFKLVRAFLSSVIAKRRPSDLHHPDRERSGLLQGQGPSAAHTGQLPAQHKEAGGGHDKLAPHVATPYAAATEARVPYASGKPTGPHQLGAEQRDAASTMMVPPTATGPFLEASRSAAEAFQPDPEMLECQELAARFIMWGNPYHSESLARAGKNGFAESTDGTLENPRPPPMATARPPGVKGSKRRELRSAFSLQPEPCAQPRALELSESSDSELLVPRVVTKAASANQPEEEVLPPEAPPAEPPRVETRDRQDAVPALKLPKEGTTETNGSAADGGGSFQI
eukprot:TRINITY_DN14629_c0_g1_i2.p1 TRINITY_DN14629_c0_g1~~TRINITY_DN14629_c0_g1_i2.p1  ORF type:complete len:606 (-),score=136.69 TRINITY_DN14629_c0_g1_i2:221-2038(-)